MAIYQILEAISKEKPYWFLGDERTLEIINEPHWNEAGRVHDWRNHVSEYLIEFWGALSQETKVVIYLEAERNASREEWE